jgi:hypothetical protein
VFPVLGPFISSLPPSVSFAFVLHALFWCFQNKETPCIGLFISESRHIIFVLYSSFSVPEKLPHVIVTLFPLQEFLVKNADREELMAMLGLFGGIFSAIQMYPCFGQMESGDVGIVMCI